MTTTTRQAYQGQGQAGAVLRHAEAKKATNAVTGDLSRPGAHVAGSSTVAGQGPLEASEGTGGATPGFSQRQGLKTR